MNKFWEQKSLSEMSSEEWESLCDGCGLCCLVKLIDADTEELVYTKLVCRQIDQKTCQCSDYANRQQKVPDCVRFEPDTIGDINWLPESCAYVRLANGKKLSSWHPLITGDPNSVHSSGISIQGWSILETPLNMQDPEDFIIGDPVDLYVEED